MNKRIKKSLILITLCLSVLLLVIYGFKIIPLYSVANSQTVPAKEFLIAQANDPSLCNADRVGGGPDKIAIHTKGETPTDNKTVGIGTACPTSKLDVRGGIKSFSLNVKDNTETKNLSVTNSANVIGKTTTDQLNVKNQATTKTLDVANTAKIGELQITNKINAPTITVGNSLSVANTITTKTLSVADKSTTNSLDVSQSVNVTGETTTKTLNVVEGASAKTLAVGNSVNVGETTTTKALNVVESATAKSLAVTNSVSVGEAITTKILNVSEQATANSLAVTSGLNVGETIATKAINVAEQITANSLAVASALNANATTTNTLSVLESATTKALTVGDALNANTTTTNTLNVLESASTKSLSVGSSVNVGETITTKTLEASGRVKVASIEITGGADFAESFDYSYPDFTIQPGTLMAIDPEYPGQLKISDKAYNRTVVGVVSGANGIKAGLTLKDTGTIADGRLPVALIGRVYCLVDTSNGQIFPGDLLTTSNIPGYAMKVTDYTQAQGAIIGKAMTNLKSDRGMVLVLISLQ